METETAIQEPLQKMKAIEQAERLEKKIEEKSE